MNYYLGMPHTYKTSSFPKNLLGFGDKVLLRSLGWHQTHYIAKPRLKWWVSDLSSSSSSSWLLGLYVCMYLLVCVCVVVFSLTKFLGIVEMLFQLKGCFCPRFSLYWLENPKHGQAPETHEHAILCRSIARTGNMAVFSNTRHCQVAPVILTQGRHPGHLRVLPLPHLT